MREAVAKAASSLLVFRCSPGPFSLVTPSAVRPLSLSLFSPPLALSLARRDCSDGCAEWMTGQRHRGSVICELRSEPSLSQNPIQAPGKSA